MLVLDVLYKPYFFPPVNVDRRNTRKNMLTLAPLTLSGGRHRIAREEQNDEEEKVVKTGKAFISVYVWVCVCGHKSFLKNIFSSVVSILYCSINSNKLFSVVAMVVHICSWCGSSGE